MDIRVINSEGMVINATKLHLMARNVFFIGLTEDMKNEVLIEKCRSKEEAVAYLDAVKCAIKTGLEEESESILIDLEGKIYQPLDDKCYKCEGGCKCGESEHN